MSGAVRGPDAGWERVFAAAEVVVVGPAPPLRGGIAAHTARLVEHLQRQGVAVAAASYRRLYPRFLFPGRSQRSGATRPAWCGEVLDVLDPSSWAGLRRRLAASRARVVLQWWHPVVAPALLAATWGLERERLVLVCHNALPHDALPGATAAARALLAKCGRVLCHSGSEAAIVRRLLGAKAGEIHQVPLPCLLPVEEFEGAAGGAAPAELAALPAHARLFVAAGHQRHYKGTAVLLRAWARARRPPGARLLVVGESYLRGRARREVTGLARDEPSIVLIDRYVEDGELVRFLDSAEALVAAHLAASQSGLIPIARALDLPCIVSDAGGLPEQAGAGARPDAWDVVQAGDEQALTAALEAHLARAPRPRTREATVRDEVRRRDFVNDWQRVVEAMGMARRP